MSLVAEAAYNYMDKYSGKRAVGGLCVPKKSSSLVLRDAADSRSNGDVQLCSRIGCSGRLNYTKAAQIGSSMKSKSWRPSSHLASGKVTSGSSSNTSSIMHNAKKKIPDSRRTLRPKLETETSESSSAQDETESQEVIVSPRTNPRRCQSELREAESRKVASVEVGRSTIVSKARNQNSLSKRPGLFTNQDASLSSSSSSSSESTGQGTRGYANANRHGLRHLRTSIADALRPSSSLSESNCSKRRDVKKRNPEGEGSSSGGGKKTSGQPSDNGHISNPTNGFTFPDSRRNRDWPATRESGVASVRTRRLMNGNIRTGHSNQIINVNTFSSVESSVVAPQVPQSERNVSANANSLHEEGFSSRSSSYSHSNTGGNVDRTTTVTSAELEIGRLMNRDGLRRYNMDGIAEVLLALERIEQDEELTYEQLLALETNLFLGGLSFYDQHRDMRLDIDNMSYEELLALEERMGNVSTALSEDELLKSVTVSTYQLISMEKEEAAHAIEGDDNKCSICQEEYMVGDEVGKIRCEHGYHMGCIKQWLQLKKWCPICKASVEPPKTA